MRTKKGMSHLLIILIVMFILLLLGFSIQLLVLMQARSSANVINAQKSYFAAEGVMNETVVALRQGYNSGTFNANDVTIGDTTIKRSVLGDEEGYRIYIEANTRGVRRSLEGLYKSEVAATNKADVMLIIDRSSSMAFWPEDDLCQETRDNYVTSLQRVKEAAHAFVDVLEANDTGGNYLFKVMGVAFSRTIFSSTPQYTPGSWNDGGYSYARTWIDGITSSGETNISMALDFAANKMEDEDRSGADRIFVLFSDGAPNYDLNLTGTPTCTHDACPVVGSPYRPYSTMRIGTFCSDEAINIASTIKGNNIKIISVALSAEDIPCAHSACGDPAATGKLGRMILLEASSEPVGSKLTEDGGSGNYEYYYETTDPDALEDIFKKIAVKIASPASFSYKEVEPD